MKKILNYLKQNRLPIPIGFGLLLSKIPFSKRPGIGTLYASQQNAIPKFKNLTEQEKEEYIFRNFKKIFTYAYENIKFYKELYEQNNIKPSDITKYEDIQKVPVITKQNLAAYDIEERSFPVANRLLVNTGGSSGKPFAFYMDPGRYGNEWAHIHDMWSKLGYRPHHLKLSFDGRVKKNNEIVYDFARNSLLFDIYADPALMRDQLLKIIKKHKVRYLHGYPSAIYEFALYCENDKELLQTLRKQLKAAFLSSEFPSPHYRNKIEEIFGISTQSFYGHTETCVLAVETEKFVYESYQTYGYAEAIPSQEKHCLVGTSYFNFASPLIRYNTGDLIEPLNADEKILSKFTIKEGRSGEFILDRNNKKIPLTGLIYGRHHQLFNFSEHIQVYQASPGKATIYYVSKLITSDEEVPNLFNTDNIEIDFEFKKIDKPILTSSGKTNLLVKSVN